MKITRFSILSFLSIGLIPGCSSTSRVPVDDQILKLQECGIKVNPEAKKEDLFTLTSESEMEKTPFRGVIEGLAMNLERNPFLPICNKLWLCDYERIEDGGDYKSIIERLDLMTDGALGIKNITDSVELGNRVAWVEFEWNGSKIHWDAKFEDDWMDPYIVVKFDSLLKESNAGIRIYSNHTDYGQSALFASFTKDEWARFQKISKVRLDAIEE